MINRTIRFSVCAVFVWTVNANAGNYSVSPLGAQFSQTEKSAVITVTNDDRKFISLRIRASRWTQDSAGNDQYTDTSDLIFFPKRLDLQPGDKRIVRVGVNVANLAEEKGYRLFIEELPPAQVAKTSQTTLSVLVTIGVPIFISGEEAKPELKITEAKLENDRLELTVVNSGNSRSRISRLLGEDGTLVSENITSRYVFPGITKKVVVNSPRDLCREGGKKIQLESDNDVRAWYLLIGSACQG